MTKKKHACNKCGFETSNKIKERAFKWIVLALDGTQPAWFDVYQCENCGHEFGHLVEPKLDEMGVRVVG